MAKVLTVTKLETEFTYDTLFLILLPRLHSFTFILLFMWKQKAY